MTSPKRVEANRKNAAKSTGPKTDAGKARTARNSTKHGLTAQLETVPDALDGYRETLRGWVDELRPSGVVERALVERACRGAWRLDRCARYEDAAVARLARDAAERHVRDATTRADWLGRRLVTPHDFIGCPRPDPVAEGDDPGSLLAELISTAQGADWLLARWADLSRALEENGTWDTGRMVAAIRMIGRRPEDVLDDQAVLMIVTSCHALNPDPKILYLDCCQVLGIDIRYPGNKERCQSIGDRRPTPERASLTLKQMVGFAIEELKSRKARSLDARAATDREGAADLALLDMGPSASLLLRYEGASSRQLHRSLADLAKLRKEASQSVRRDEEASTARDADAATDSPPPEAARPAADAGDAGPDREESAKQTQREAARGTPNPARGGPTTASRPLARRENERRSGKFGDRFSLPSRFYWESPRPSGLGAGPVIH